MPIDGDRVMRYRVRRGMSRKDLASESGYSYSQVSQIERGETGGSEHSAKALATALRVTIDDIWNFEEN